MSILGYHFNRLSLILSTLEALLFCVVFMLAGRFLLIGTSQADVDLVRTVLLPSGLLLLCLIALGSYHLEAWRSVQIMARRLFASALCGSLLIVVSQYLLLGYWPSPAKIAFCAGLSCLIALGARLIGRKLTGLRSRLKPRALILGAGAKAETLWRALGHGFHGPNVDGFIQLEESHATPAAVGLLPTQRILGMPSDLAAYVKNRRIEEIVIALDNSNARLPEQDLLHCRMDGVTVTDSASFAERITGRVKLDLMESDWLIFAPGFRRGRLRSLAKRGTDLIYSTLILAAALPLLPLIALLIKLDSPGPVLYRQKRVGLDGQVFEIYKFRSMCIDAEADGKARWARTADDRVTQFGHVLRQSRLDELPQLFNVLKGDMSMVGPRPERPEFTSELAAALPLYPKRHTVRPGITGWAQINYPYGASIEDAREKLEYDLYYVKNYSLFLDLVTMVQTARIAFGGIGAR
ncbi:MAG: TIGR03013 family PEP-CTERM/XrtA system glycosyltransferase [Alphaproteobacteria bacterium]|nr:TIGR03013 family PEP-CTERM/XrtA system glycosyltransferase [Alphaproteobacteria bacterium]